jgi:hypothetical protein
MEIRIANALEIFVVRNTADFRACRERVSRPMDLQAWFGRLNPGKRRCRLLAEREGHALGYLIGAISNAHGLLEDFLICTNEGINEVSYALLEIFELLCVQRNCRSVLAPGWMDEVLIQACGFQRSGKLFVKTFKVLQE